MSGDKSLKRMVDLLKSGATMLGRHCPECNSPLFNIKGEIWCPTCNKRIIIVKEGEEQLVVTSSVLSKVEDVILQKIQESSRQIAQENDTSKLETLSDLMNNWLEVLERLRKIQKL